MNKLPVFRTAGRAIGFTLWNSFTIFRLAWFPFAALLTSEIALSMFILQSFGETPKGLPNPLTINIVLEKVVAFDVAFLVLQAIAIAAVAVSIHRVILFGDRRPGQYFNFAFGKTEFLYIVMGVLTAIILLMVFAAILLPFALLVSNGDPVGMIKAFVENPETLGPAMKRGVNSGWLGLFFGFYLVAYIVLLYLSLRLAVWPPSVVATNRISFREAWELTRGNVWRLIGAFLLTFGWIYLLVIIPAVGGYWYYMHKIEHGGDVPAISAPATPAAEEPAKPGTEASAPAAAPEATASAAPSPEAAPQGTAPQAAPDAPIAAPALPAPASPDAAPPTTADGPDNEALRRQLDALVGPFIALIWFIELLLLIYGTALAVALMSFSYKALKGYEAHEPIPAHE